MSEATQLKPGFDAEEYACVIREIHRTISFIDHTMLALNKAFSRTEENHVADLAECANWLVGKQIDLMEILDGLVGVDCSWGPDTKTLDLMERPTERIADTLTRRARFEQERRQS